MAIMVINMEKKRIIDIHNHSLPFVDDGVQSKEEALKNIKHLQELGITDIILTSHYIINSKYEAPLKQRKAILQELKDELKDEDINLYLGNEVFINNSDLIIKLIKDRKISTLNGSNYLLIEFPQEQLLHNLEEIICNLNEEGLIPIIAHPERYLYYQKDITGLKKLLEYNCLIECNLLSLTGVYGRAAQKTMKKLLQEQLVTTVATDMHHLTNKRIYEKAYKKLFRTIPSAYLQELLTTNPLKIIENKELR